MRICAALLLIFSLAACHHGTQNNDAVRQGVIDHLTKAGLNVKGMDVNLSSVQINGSQADATVSITPKGGNAAQGMSIKYHLEQQGNQWVVTGRQNADGSPHEGATMPSAPNPHGGAMPPQGGTSPMPSPQDLPPAGKK